MSQKTEKTKQEIKEALIQLLHEKPLEDISVSLLSQTAKINRGTFYLHYLDKYDLMDQLKAETWATIKDIHSSTKSTPDKVMESLTYLKKEFPLISIVAASDPIQFKETIQDFILQLLMIEESQLSLSRELYPIPESYALPVFLASMEAIISTWIQLGAKEDPRIITEMILSVGKFRD